MTTPSKARMVPADQPEVRVFKPGDVVYSCAAKSEPFEVRDAEGQVLWRVVKPCDRLTGHDGDHHWPALVFPNASLTEHAPHAARPATPSAPATPAVGAGSSEGAEGSQIGVHESGLGARIRDVLARTGVPSEFALREWAERADVLEAAYRVADAEIARLTEFHDHYRAQVERVRVLADEIEHSDQFIGVHRKTLVRKIRAALDGTQ